MVWDKIKIPDIIKIYGPILISIVALIISIRSCDISNNSLNMNKQEFEKRREARLFIGASWTGDKIYMSRLKKSQLIPSTRHGDLYEGLEGFIILKITNTSDHTISIDGIGIGYCSKSSVMSIPWSGKFKSVDMQTDIVFPIILNPYEPFRCVTRVPIPISASLESMMQDLRSDTTYSFKDINLRIAYYLIKNKAKSRSPDSLEAIIKKEIEFFGFMTGGGMQNVPEMLITYSDPNLIVRRGERSLEVEVKLSSGELVVRVLDYIDINRSSFDLLSAP
jgi:hypothetical protein